MKKIPLEQFGQNVSGFVEAAQRERIVITLNDQPLALVIGIENKDEEDLRMEGSPEFWRMIEESRQRPTRLLKEVETELFSEEIPAPTDGSKVAG